MIELLQDDKVRSVINPGLDQESHSPHGQPEEAADQFDDEEDMFEMMAMQEECRLEMMKFYIQSQNPKLFEEVYHGVSYPDEAPQQQTETFNDAPSTSDSSDSQAQPEQANATAASDSSSPQSSTSSTNSASLKDLIVNDLNTNATDFDPTQLSNLNLNEKNN